jgi:hypothetical protein
MDIVNKTLVALIISFAIMLILVDKIFNSEGEVFQVFSTLLSGFSAAFIARITPRPVEPPAPPAAAGKSPEPAPAPSGTIIASPASLIAEPPRP